MHGGAHPRLRGADVEDMQATAAEWGSSPLTRGGPARIAGRAAVVGLIPAYAGRTAGVNGRDIVGRAHPRLRGADTY